MATGARASPGKGEGLTVNVRTLGEVVRDWLHRNLRNISGSAVFLSKMAWYFLLALTSFTLLYFAITYFFPIQDGEVPAEIKALELTSRIFVFLSAGAFFLYKVRSGFHFVNASIDIDIQRPGDPAGGDDYLAISVNLSRGDSGTLVLHNLFVRIKTKDGADLLKGEKVSGLERLDSKALRNGSWRS